MSRISQENTRSVFNKVSVPKKRLRHRCFPVKFAKFLRTTILRNVCKRLFLNSIQKETPTQALSSEVCELLKNTCFVEHLRKVGSETPMRGLSLIKLQAYGLKAFSSIKKRL